MEPIAEALFNVLLHSHPDKQKLVEYMEDMYGMIIESGDIDLARDFLDWLNQAKHLAGHG